MLAAADSGGPETTPCGPTKVAWRFTHSKSCLEQDSCPDSSERRKAGLLFLHSNPRRQHGWKEVPAFSPRCTSSCNRSTARQNGLRHSPISGFATAIVPGSWRSSTNWIPGQSFSNGNHAAERYRRDSGRGCRAVMWRPDLLKAT